MKNTDNNYNYNTIQSIHNSLLLSEIIIFEVLLYSLTI